MLCIEKIKYKNILSAGNQFIEVELDKHKTTILKGLNGQGKSLLITSLIFGLYGRSNRGTTKKQLVNSVNKKDCVVEVDFSSNGKQYKIVRGISPNIFQIYINGKLQEELSAMRDQQKYLEQAILKMSYKTFMQVVVLGSNNYVPFMELSASDRRELVEELLDIKIFSSMNIILKEKIKKIESDLSNFNMQEVHYQGLIESQKQYIEANKKEGKDSIDKRQKEVEELQNKVTEILEIIEEKNNQLNELNEALSSIKFNPKKLKQFLEFHGKIKQRKSLVKNEIGFFNEHSNCPTCKQVVNEEFKKEKLIELDSVSKELENGEVDLLNEIKQEEERENNFLQLSREIRDLNSSITELNNKIQLNNHLIRRLLSEIEEVENKLNSKDVYTDNLKKFTSELKKMRKEKSKCKEVLEYFEFSHMLMKDNGIKTKIIENYLPVMNAQINKYLQMLDLYINFSLDGEFKESINTPIHENFSYGCFSEGEKQRINLSLLLAWRDIARMKNSVNCNLMFFDETLDSSLDGAGIDDMMKIINYIVKDSNIVIISHRDGYDDKFERVLEVKKVNGFSKIFS